MVHELYKQRTREAKLKPNWPYHIVKIKLYGFSETILRRGTSKQIEALPLESITSRPSTKTL